MDVAFLTTIDNSIATIQFLCYFILFYFFNFGQVNPQFRVGQLVFFGHIFRQYHCRNSFFLSPTSVTSFLSPLSYFFLEFRQWCCQNSLLSSFPQISLNNTYITNKLDFLPHSAKRLKASSFGPFLFFKKNIKINRW